MTTQYTKKFVRYLRNTKAVSALEYAILIGIVAVAIGTAIGVLGGDISTAIQNIGGQVDDIDGAAINDGVTTGAATN